MFSRISAGLLVMGVVLAQEPAFDAVSVRRVKIAPIVVVNGGWVDAPFQGFQYTPGRVTCRLQLLGILKEAYGVRSDAIKGPAALRGDYYDLQATMPAGTKRAEARLMLRRMLAERFGLKVHEEARETEVYALVVGPKGAKVKEAAKPEELGRVTSGVDLYESTNDRMSGLVEFLSWRMEQPVIDRTQLTGRYDMRLEMRRRDEEEEGISVQTALAEQLGLKLEKRREPWPMIVVDHVEETPTEN